MDTEKDKLKNSHRAASVEKRETGKEKSIQSRRRPKTEGLRSMTSLLTRLLLLMKGYTERYQPSLSLFWRAEKKRDVSRSYFTASEATQVGSRERREGVWECQGIEGKKRAPSSTPLLEVDYWEFTRSKIIQENSFSARFYN